MTSTLAPIPVMRPAFGPEEAAAVAEAVQSGWVAQGPRVAAFEAAFAEAVGAADGIALSSCTAALHLAMVLLDIGPGDEVVVPSLSFIATANAVRYVGATPVFADVDPQTLALTPATIAEATTERTRAVILVHQAGVPADIDSVQEACARSDIAVVEDAACAAGAEYRSRPIGAGADLATFSFHPRKLITTGEGGMLVTSRPDWAARARRLREHGMSVSAADRHQSRDVVIEGYAETGFNYRMTDIQAALGLVQLSRLGELVERRRLLAARYIAALGAIPGLYTSTDPPYGTTNFQSFWVLLPEGFSLDRDGLMRAMMDREIFVRRGIMAAHQEPAYAGAGAEHPPLPVTELFAARSVVLPLYHQMSGEDQDRVIDVVLEAAGRPGA